jgi:phosphoserine phosphatase
MDKPGITATVTQTLASYDVNILDIGQSVIHDALSLGMLVQIPEQVENDQLVLDDIQKQIEGLGLVVRFVNISRESYENWVGQQGKGRHIVTLLSRRITAYQISRLSRTVAENGLNIDKITVSPAGSRSIPSAMTDRHVSNFRCAVLLKIFHRSSGKS